MISEQDIFFQSPVMSSFLRGFLQRRLSGKDINLVSLTGDLDFGQDGGLGGEAVDDWIPTGNESWNILKYMKNPMNHGYETCVHQCW